MLPIYLDYNATTPIDKEVAEAMKKGFEEEFQVELIEGMLSKEEQIVAKKIEKECFSAMKWNHRR